MIQQTLNNIPTASKLQPKEMLPVYDKPTSQYVVEEAVASGINDNIIVTGRHKRSIEDHFKNLNSTFKRQEKTVTLKKSEKSLIWQTSVMSDKRSKMDWAMQSNAVKDILEENLSLSF